MNQVLVLKGVSGSGKSTLITRLEKEYGQPGIICSADNYHYFGKDKILENYKFDINNLHAAHKQCQRKFIEALNVKASLVIVDNTNIKIKDYKWYYKTAREYNYNVTFHTILPGTIEQHVVSNVHNVPREVLEKMIQDLKPCPTEINGELIDEVFYDFNELRNNK